MDLASLIGFIAGIAFVVVSVLMSAGYDVDKALKVVDAPSVMITVGGTIASLLISHPLSRISIGLKSMGKIFVPPKIDPAIAIRSIITLANLARKEGLLSLEDAVNVYDDEFLKKGINLVVDGTDPELVRNILETEMSYIESRHAEARGMWETVGVYGPSWGMIGTLIGLIMMLQDMSDPDALGPSMAIAIVTTFYGSLIANFIANPTASKLKIFSTEEVHVRELLVEGILAIQAGENPRIIEEKLKAFLAPTLRATIGDEKGGVE
ncbi:motility protein A [Clostridia bacterium]|nr:motility protein A [Clostridia bacterium]